MNYLIIIFGMFLLTMICFAKLNNNQNITNNQFKFNNKIYNVKEIVVTDSTIILKIKN